MAPHTTAPASAGHAAAAGGLLTALLATVLVLGELATLDVAVAWFAAGQFHLSRAVTIGVGIAGGALCLWAAAMFLRRALAAERALARGRYGASVLLEPGDPAPQGR